MQDHITKTFLDDVKRIKGCEIELLNEKELKMSQRKYKIMYWVISVLLVSITHFLLHLKGHHTKDLIDTSSSGLYESLFDGAVATLSPYLLFVLVFINKYALLDEAVFPLMKSKPYIKSMIKIKIIQFFIFWYACVFFSECLSYISLPGSVVGSIIFMTYLNIWALNNLSRIGLPQFPKVLDALITKARG